MHKVFEETACHRPHVVTDAVQSVGHASQPTISKLDLLLFLLKVNCCNEV